MTKQIIFVDSNVENYQTLLKGVNVNTQIVILDAENDGIKQIGQTLEKLTNLEAIHILSHGSSGSLQLGNSILNNSNLELYASHIKKWRNSLTENAEILLYGCCVAALKIGREFVRTLSQLSEAKVAASTNLTGNSTLGGDWNLEFTTGPMKTPLAFNSRALASYNGVLGEVHFNLSSVFNIDGIVNLTGGVTDTTQNTLDLTNNALITQSFATFSQAGGLGLPDNGFFAANAFRPNIDLQYDNTDNGNNIGLINTSTGSLNFAVTPGLYSEVHIAALSTEATSDIRLVFNYSDGTTATTSTATVPDWYNDITETTSLYYLLDSMDRASTSGVFQDANAPALFGLQFVNPNSAKTVTGITVEKTASSGYLALFGATGIDNIAPTVSLTSAASTTVNAPFNVTATFSESTSNFIASDISVTNGTISNFSGSGTTYTFTVNPTAQGTVTVDVPAGVATDTAGNNNIAATALTRTFDSVAPTVTSTTPTDNATNFAVGDNLIVNFTEAIQKGTGNIVIKKVSDNSVVETIDVASTNVTVSGSTVTINPTADLAESTEYYVEIANGAIQDLVGNNYSGIIDSTTWNFTTADTTAPAAPAITSISSDTGTPNDGITNDTTLSFTGTAEANSTVTLFKESTSIGTTTADASGNWTFDYTGSTLTDGTVSFTATATDAASNTSSPSAPITVTLDTTTPTVTIDQDPGQADPTAGSTVNFAVVFSEAVTGFDGSDITLGGTAGATTATVTGSGTTYNVAVTGMTNPGTVTAIINSGVATDAAGNSSAASTSSDNEVTYNNTIPTVTTITRTDASPSNASTVNYTVTFSENVTGVDASDFSLAPGSIADAAITNVTGTGNTYTVTVNTGSGDGTLQLNLNDDDSIINSLNIPLGGVGTSNGNSTGQIYTIDKTGASVTNITSTLADGNYSVGQIIPITITFDEVISVTSTPQLSFNSGGSADYASGSGTNTLTFNYTVAAGHTASDLEALTLSLAGGTIKDSTGNDAILTLPAIGAANSLGANKNIAISTTAPGIASLNSTQADGNYSAGQVIAITVTFDTTVNVTGIPQLTLNSGGVATYSGGTGTNALTFSYTIAADQSAADLDATALNLASGTIKDTAGNNATLTLPAASTPSSLGGAKNIVIDTSAPSVSTVTSSLTNGNYAVGQVIPIAVNFSEAVNVTGAPQLSLNSGGVATYSSGSGTNSLIFNYTVAAGQNTADLDYASVTALALNGGTIRDTAGNNATLTLPTIGAVSSLGGAKNIAIDTSVPSVTLATTAASTVNAPFNVTATFSESVNGFIASDLSITNGTVSNFTGTGDKYSFTVTPTANGPVTVNLPASGATDVAGNNNTAAVALTRTFDNVAPASASLTPADNATRVAVGANLVIQLSEAVQKGTGNIVIKKVSDNSVVETINATSTNVTVSGNSVTINPTADLAQSTQYYVEIGNGAIKDLAGNNYTGITGATAWNFTTADTTAPTTTTFTPADNTTSVDVDTNLVVAFSEAVQKGTGNIVIKKVSDNSVVETINVTSTNVTVSGNSVTVNPTADLAETTPYYVEITNGAIKDLAGNNYAGITGATPWNFTTTDSKIDNWTELKNYLTKKIGNVSPAVESVLSKLIEKVNPLTVEYENNELTVTYDGEVDFSKFSVLPLVTKIAADLTIPISEPSLTISELNTSTPTYKLAGKVNFEEEKDGGSPNFLDFINEQLKIKEIELETEVKTGTSQELSVSADLSTQKLTLLKASDLWIELTGAQLNITATAGTSLPTFGIGGSVSIKGYDPFQANEPELKLSGKLVFDPKSITSALQLESKDPWKTPFGLPNSEIRNLALQVGGTYVTPWIDNVGFVGDLKFGNFDLKSAFFVSSTEPKDFAVELTANNPINIVDLWTGPVSSYLINQVGNQVDFVNRAESFLKQTLDVNIVSVDSSDADTEIDPLLKLVPVNTEIADTKLTQGLGINGQVRAWGKTATLSLNANPYDVINPSLEGFLQIPEVDLGFLKLTGADGPTDKTLDFAVKVSPTEQYLKGDGRLDLLGTTVAKANVEFTSTSAKVKDFDLNLGVLALDINDLSVDINNKTASGSGSVKLLGREIAGAKINADSNGLKVQGNLDLFGVFSIENALIDVKSATNITIGGTAKIFGQNLLNAKISIQNGKLNVTGGIGIDLPLIPNLSANLTITSDGTVSGSKVTVDYQAGPINGNYSLSLAPLRSVEDVFAQAADKTFGAVTEVVNKAIDGVVNGFNSVTSTVLDQFNKVGQFFADAWKSVTSWLESDNQTIKGDNGNNFIDAEDGHDEVFGEGGNDYLKGGTGEDRLHGWTGDDKLEGGTGRDTIYGQDGTDLVLGGDQNDHLTGDGGNDKLNGGLHDDFLSGGSGNDFLYGEEDYDRLNGDEGDDVLYGGSGNDTLDAWTGNDRLYGDIGNDYLDGGSGNDEIHGYYDHDTLLGGLGNDLLYGQQGRDLIEGGDGDDLLYGEDNGKQGQSYDGSDDHDTLNGGNGNDYLFGGLGNDNLNGGDGNDNLNGGDGNDNLRGDPGNDLLDGGNGNDNLDGGVGDDRLYGREGDDALSGWWGKDYLDGGNGNDTLYSHEGDDILEGQAGNDHLASWVGSDILNGGEGNDSLYGEGDNDTLSGGNGSNVLDGGDGTDTADYRFSSAAVNVNLNNGNATFAGNTDRLTSIENVIGSANNDIVFGNAGNNTLSGQAGNDGLYGESGNDLLRGEEGNDEVHGWEGNDTLEGGTGNDTLYGQQGDDFIQGGDGNDALYGEGNSSPSGSSSNDTLSGGAGDDSLFGGVGNDYLDSGEGNDTINGGDGTDTLLLAGNKENYQFTETETGWRIVALNGDVKIVTKVENFEFKPKFIDFDLSSVFDRDVIVNHNAGATDPTQDGLSNWNETLVTQSFASFKDNANGNGLPNSGFFRANAFSPNVQLGYNNTNDGKNAKVLTANNQSFTFNVTPNNYSEIHLFATSTNGEAGMQVTFKYSDGTTGTSTASVPDWFDEIPTPSFNRYSLIDGMDRSLDTTGSNYQDANDPAIFGFGFKPNPAKTLQSITVNKTSGATNNWLGVFGGTGVLPTPGTQTLNTDSVRKYYKSRVIDGYIANGKIFFDANLNGALDENEPFTITLADGSFDLNVEVEKFDTNQNGELDYTEGKFILMGGMDILSGVDAATGLLMATPLTSTLNSTVVTPLTTIIAEMVQQGIDPATAETNVKTALGLPSGVDLGSYDPLEAIAKGDTQGVSVFGSMIQVQNTIVQMAKFIEGVSKTEVAQLAFSGISAIANQLKDGTAVDLGNAETIQAILTEAITKAAQSDPQINVTQLANAAAAAAQVMALGNQIVKELVASGRPIKDIALEITKLQAVSVGQIAVGLPELAAGTISIEEFLANNSKEAILARMATVEVNDPTVRPEVKPINFSDSGTDNPDTDTGNPTPPLPFPRVEDTTTGVPTPGDDNLTYGFGDDTVVALPGNDIILGGDGNDLLFGNTGNDLLNGQGGNDFIYGGKDQDTLIGEFGNDTLCGDIGDDSLSGNDGDDVLYGNQGNDILDGGLGNDTLRGGKENDTLLGADGNDVLCGDIGDDSLLGDAGNDMLFGNQGNDFLDGGVGDNTLHGGKDNDTLVGNQGVDILCGDIGNDSLSAGSGNDMLFGNSEQDILDAGDGDDTLHGGQGNDTLIGGTGNDLLDGDFGNDILTGGAGNDGFVLELGTGADIITDFKIGEDSLVLVGGLSFQQLTITAGNNASLISVGDELLATLNDVDSSLLNQQSFSLL